MPGGRTLLLGALVRSFIRKYYEAVLDFGMLEIWPNFEVFVHGGFHSRLNELFKTEFFHRQDADYMETYNAS
jgi:hypothetical protein